MPETADNRLVNIGLEITKPSFTLQALINEHGDYAKTLPAAPTAILLVIVGFTCISLVRDRKIWLTVLNCILWAGCAGACFVPQLAQHLVHQTHISKRFSMTEIKSYLLRNNSRQRCNIDGSEYIGLLNHLAGIPACRYTAKFRYIRTSTKFSQQRNNFTIQPPTKSLFLPTNLLSAWARVCKNHICFINPTSFQKPVRGPPHLQLK